MHFDFDLLNIHAPVLSTSCVNWSLFKEHYMTMVIIENKKILPACLVSHWGGFNFIVLVLLFKTSKINKNSNDLNNLNPKRSKMLVILHIFRIALDKCNMFPNII